MKTCPPSLKHKLRGLSLTEYLIILALIAIAAIGAISLLGQRSRQNYNRSNAALVGVRTDTSTEPELSNDSTVVQSNFGNFTDSVSPSSDPTKPISTGGADEGWVASINSGIRSLLPPELASRFRGIDNPNWQAGKDQALSDASLLADVAPVVGTVKAFFELATGEDPLTGEEKSRIQAAIGVALSLIPAGKGGKAAVEVVEVGAGVEKTVIKEVIEEGADAASKLGKLTKIGEDAWQSSGGLKYVGLDKNGLNRVEHVLRHTIPEGPGHSVFSVPRNKLLALLDEAYTSTARFPVAGDPAAFITPMGRTVGTAGENAVRLILRPGTSEVISAYPVKIP